ncbi:MULTISPECIES: histidine phosphatase family protein [Terrabacter]|uniref:Isomerase n=1 Tax=Terrabacter tumescens TaxID=60443 RepID=A0ABQ2I977_9MICO|nr:histidine phosphatase family protein [Terrabacter tumescens]WVM97046.1 histidine phosphatase family protein [Terrabacter sp. C0L_2]GGN00752.1 isomerase [Terrabacter tumescens]
MRLFLVRHGQTHANVARQLDTAVPGVDLTEEGRAQARALADRLGGEDLGAIYTSDLVRTQQTAAPLAELLGLEMVVLPGLREIQAGDYEMSTDWQPYIDAVVRWRDDPEHTIPGGDSGAVFMERYDAAIASIASDGHASAVAVSHGAAMRVWCSASLGLSAEFFDGRRLDNAHVVTMEGDPETGWRLLAWGDEPVTHG